MFLYAIKSIYYYRYLIQVTCERSFFKLKYIKTRLRSSFSYDLLESYMFMSLEQKKEVSHDELIDYVLQPQNLKRC